MPDWTLKLQRSCTPINSDLGFTGCCWIGGTNFLALFADDGGGGNDYCWKSTDDGKTWTNFFTFNNATTFFLIKSKMLSPAVDTALVGGRFGQIGRTTNGGTAWSVVWDDGASDILVFADAGGGVLYAFSGRTGPASIHILKSTDTGATWSDLGAVAGLNAHYAQLDQYALCAPAAGTILVGTNAANTDTPRIFRTVNDGVAWSTITLPAAGYAGSGFNVQDIRWLGGNTVLAGGVINNGKQAKLWLSTDLGATWADISTLIVDSNYAGSGSMGVCSLSDLFSSSRMWLGLMHFGYGGASYPQLTTQHFRSSMDGGATFSRHDTLDQPGEEPNADQDILATQIAVGQSAVVATTSMCGTVPPHVYDGEIWQQGLLTGPCADLAGAGKRR